MSRETFKGNTDRSSGDAVEEILSDLRRLVADVCALYVKTKNFYWHISGRRFRDNHLLLDEQSMQIFAVPGQRTKGPSC